MDLYISNKKDYINLSRRKYAIVMLCMLKDHYVLGACISAYAHRKLKPDNCDLVIMCDDIIYNEHHELLKKFFDRVIKIDLDTFDLSEKYKFSGVWIKKYGWINHSTSKWKCLLLTEYSKILFMDIDILPVNKLFYTIFKQHTPSFLICVPHLLITQSHTKVQGSIENCIDDQKISNPINRIDTYDEYINQKEIESLNGGLVLLKPNKKTYKKYKKFITEIYKDGIYSHKLTGPDETSLYYYYTKIRKNKKYHNICRSYISVPWDDPVYITQKAYSYNFLSYVKPWLKPLFLSWGEETIWRDLYNEISKDDRINESSKKPLEGLLKKSLISGYEYFISGEKQSAFNDEYIKNFPEKVYSIKDNITFDNIIKIENELINKNKNYGILNLQDLL